MTVAMAVYVFRYEIHDLRSFTSFMQQHKSDVQVACSYAAMHISSVNCFEITGDRARQFADKIFSIERIFQQSKSRLAKSMEALARARQIGLPPEKSDLLLIVTSTADKFSRGTWTSMILNERKR